MQRLFISSGAVLMALAVMLGAFGAHGLRESLGVERLAVWNTAVEYQAWHALGLLLLGALHERLPAGGANAAGLFMLAGIGLFSGSLYLLMLTGMAWLGPITPMGGMAFIIAWLILAWAAWKGLGSR